MTKESIINAYGYNNICVKLNDYSTLTIQEVNEIACANFLPKYSVLNIKIISSFDTLEEDVKDFTEFIKDKVSLTLIQAYGMECATISILYNTTVPTVGLINTILKHQCKYVITI